MSGDGSIFSVPVFPLDTVLFPKMPIALQIFEERYKVMLADLARGDNRFCVALIREGVEVGGHADPYPVACLAEIAHVQTLPENRFFVVALDVERVTIISTDRASKPYLVGAVQLWPDEPCEEDGSLVAKATRLFSRYAHCMSQLAGDKLDDFSLPSDPSDLSYLLATIIQMESLARQGLLELPNSAQRLKAEVDILQAELPMLRALAGTRKPPEMGSGRFSTN